MSYSFYVPEQNPSKKRRLDDEPSGQESMNRSNQFLWRILKILLWTDRSRSSDHNRWVDSCGAISNIQTSGDNAVEFYDGVSFGGSQNGGVSSALNDSRTSNLANQNNKNEDFSVDFITFKEESGLREPQKEYFGRFQRKDTGGKAKNYIRNQNGSVKL